MCRVRNAGGNIFTSYPPDLMTVNENTPARTHGFATAFAFL